MIARVGSGWQTVLADLALILFMVTASAVSQAQDDPPPEPSGGFAMAEPVAVWRPSPAAPTLAQWLSTQPSDPRIRLTLFVHAPSGGEAAALRLTAGAAPDAAASARIVIDREPGPPLEAILAYDQTPQPTRSTTP